MKLIEAVEENDLELVKKLINDGYNIDDKNERGWTALMCASYHVYVEIVKELIKSGASLNHKDNYGYTALIVAASYIGGVEIVKELIKAGAPLDVKNDKGKTALDYSKEIWQSFDIQDLVLTMYPDKYSFLEKKVGIHKDILLKLKMEQILNL